MHNRFQQLFCDDCPLYAAQERKNKTVSISYDYFLQKVVAPWQVAAQELARLRHTKIATQYSYAGFGAEYQTACVVEALFDPHFRKQIAYGPSRDYVREKVAAAIKCGDDLNLVGLMFTRKNSCPLKRAGADESHVDLAEISALVYLNAYCSLIQSFYPGRVRYHILSEGQRFLKAFDLCEPLVRRYQSRMQSWISRLTLGHLVFEDYEDFLARHMSDKLQQTRKKAYQDAKHLYESRMVALVDFDAFENTLEQAIIHDPVVDARNPRNHFVPLWDSIKHSLPYPKLEAYAASCGVEYDHWYYQFFNTIYQKKSQAHEEELRQHVLTRSWQAAIEHNAQVLADTRAGVDVTSYLSGCQFRTSINPKPGNHLGIRLVRETTHRVQPWHGTALLQQKAATTRLTVLSRLQIEQNQAHPIVVPTSDGDWCVGYADQTVAEKISNSSALLFAASAR